MNLYQSAKSLQPSSANSGGHWSLETRRAITVQSKGGGQLSVASGEVWATLSAGRAGLNLWRSAPSNGLEPCVWLKDYFLSSGDTLLVPMGAKVVIQAMGRAQDLPVAFDWSHTPDAVRLNPVGHASRIEQAELRHATSQLGVAVAQVLHALHRLVTAVLAGHKGPKSEQRLNNCL